MIPKSNLARIFYPPIEQLQQCRCLSESDKNLSTDDEKKRLNFLLVIDETELKGFGWEMLDTTGCSKDATHQA